MTCEKSRSNIQLKKRCAKTMYSITHFFMYPPHICVYACRLDIYTRKGKEWHEIGVPQMGNLCTFFWMFTKVIHMLYNKNLNLWTSSHTPPRPPPSSRALCSSSGRAQTLLPKLPETRDAANSIQPTGGTLQEPEGGREAQAVIWPLCVAVRFLCNSLSGPQMPVGVSGFAPSPNQQVQVAK